MKPNANSALLRFSTNDLPAADRVPFWREFFGRKIANIEVEPLSDRPFEAGATMLPLPGLKVGWCYSASPALWKRTPELVRDGDDDFVLLLHVEGLITRSQLGRELEVKDGGAVSILQAEPASIVSPGHKYVVVMVPRAAMHPLVADVEDASTRPIPRETAALRLLRGYLTTLRDTADTAEPALWQLASTHVQDLIAMTIGATRDGKQVALARGVRAARMKAIKADFAADLSLSLARIAARQGVTPRYVQILFEEEGATFTDYALEQRLTHAHRMLSDVRLTHLTIGAIAYQAAFGDLSHFNRTFRRRFGATPSEIRHAAARQRNL